MIGLSDLLLKGRLLEQLVSERPEGRGGLRLITISSSGQSPVSLSGWCGRSVGNDRPTPAIIAWVRGVFASRGIRGSPGVGKRNHAWL
jgi:hypothetical protein